LPPKIVVSKRRRRRKRDLKQKWKEKGKEKEEKEMKEKKEKETVVCFFLSLRFLQRRVCSHPFSLSKRLLCLKDEWWEVEEKQ